MLHWPFFSRIREGGLTAFGEVGRRLVELGGQGVAVFFVISGFSVSYSYVRAKGFGEYINKRFWRVAPLYYFWIVVAILAGTTNLHWQIKNDVSVDVYNVLMHMAFLSCWDYRIAPALLGVDWTLSIEMFWYFLIPLLLLYVNGFRGIMLMVAASMIFYAISILLPSLLPLPHEKVAEAVHWSPIPYALGFCLGIAAFKLRELHNDCASWGNIALIFLLLAFLVLIFCPLPIMRQTSYAFFTGVSFLLIVFGSTDNKVFRMVFANRLVLILGTLSYGIYLCHPTLIGIIEQLNIVSTMSTKFGMVLAASFAASAFAYFTIERPSLVAGKALYVRL